VANPSPTIEGSSDEQLVARLRAGDDAAFDQLVSRYQDKVYGLALRLSGNASDAEEILQDAFLQVYRKIGQFRSEAKFSTWLYRIATNSALMHRRSNKRHIAEPLDDYLPKFSDEGHIDFAANAGLDLADRADDLLERKEIAEKTLAAVARLSDTYRETFVLRDIEGLSTEEVSEILGIDPGVVRTRLHRARLMMRGFLGELVGAKA
jgi:RNA polymerase sigma-70 factor (ECF subfamily)